MVISPTETDRARLEAALCGLSPLPAEEFSAFVAGVRVSVWRKGEFFAQAAARSEQVGLVLEGLFRVYYLAADGQESVCNFHAEGSFIGPYSAMIRGTTSLTYTQALEDSRVAWMSYRHLQGFFQRNAAWERLGRRIAEGLYAAMVDREQTLMTLDAESRLAAFRAARPDLCERVSQANIASYIKVRPETLSRLHGKGGSKKARSASPKKR